MYVGGLPLELTEGDLLAICSQVGEIVHVDLCRDEETGKSKGFAFVAYEDQRSTVLAVDNLSGAKVGGRTLNVQHVGNYRKKKEALGLRVDELDEGDESTGGASGRDSENEEDTAAAAVQERDAEKEKAAPTSAPVPSWRDLVARRDAKIKSKDEEEKRKKKQNRRHDREYRKDRREGRDGRQKRRRRDGEGSEDR